MSYHRLRYNLLLLAILGSETVWMTLFALLLGTTPEGGALGWLPLFLTGALLLAWNRWLLGRDILESAQGPWLSFALAFVLVSILMRVAAPQATAGLLPGVGDWLRAITDSRGLFSIPTPLTVIALTGLLLWYRTLKIVQSPVGSLTTFAQLRQSAGLVVVLVLGLAYMAIFPPVGLIFLFFTCALVALALARADEMSQLPRIAPIPFDGRWGATLVASVFGVLLLSRLVVAVGYLLSPLFEPLALLLRSLFVLLIFPFLNFIIVPLFQWVYKDKSLPPLLSPTSPLPEAFQEESVPASSEGFPTEIVVVLGVVVVLLLFFFLATRIRRQAAPRHDRRDGADYSQIPISLNLGGWLRQHVDALRDRFTPVPQRSIGISNVRELYANLLLFGDEHGLARPLKATPYEYLAPLCQSYPHRRHDFFALTDAYVAAHYGERLFPPDEIESLQQAWRRIASEPPHESPA